MSEFQVVTLLLVSFLAALFMVVTAWLAGWRRHAGLWGTPFFHRFYWTAEFRLQQQLSWLIDRAERNARVRLTWGARQMLMIPILEVFERERGVDWDEVSRSIEIVLFTLAEEPSPDEKEGRRRSSVSVIRTFFRRFCNIPPFCSRLEEERG